jgi:hypothetical protein
MWIVKRTLGVIQLLVASLFLMVAVPRYFDSDKPSMPTKLLVMVYFAINAITGLLLLCTPRPQPKEQPPINEQDRFV